MIDIVIVNYKSTDHLENCLKSVYKALDGAGAGIFVEDNDSRDHVDRIREVFPEVVLNKNSINLGFARAVNKAARKGRAPYLLILNPDTMVKADFFEGLIAYMDVHPDVGVAGPMVQDIDGSLQRSARSFPTPLTAFFGRSSFLSKWFPKNRLTRKNLLMPASDGKTPTEVDWVSGASMLIRRKAFEDVGPFDERFFMYWEDADLCKRMWQGGWKVVYYPSALIIHSVGASSRHRVLRSIVEFHKSSYRFFDKHSKSWNRLLLPAAVAGLSVRLAAVLFLRAMVMYCKRSY